MRLTAGPYEHALSSNQSVDALFGFRGKGSRAFDFRNESLEASDLLGVPVWWNKEKRRKSNHERCDVAPARQHRMEGGNGAGGLRIGASACAWNG
jgi:hypothetical protein